MLTPADVAQMVVDFAEIVSDRDYAIQLRRGSITYAAQNVRLARTASGSRQRGDVSVETRGTVVVVGPVGWDVQIKDRFNADGKLYEVKFMRTNRDAATIIEAEVVE